MNAVKYGSTTGKSTLNIVFEYDENELRFTIEDDGSGEKAISAEELQKIIEVNKANKDLTRTSGRGLSMITQQWTDSMSVHPSSLGGIAVSFMKAIQKDEAPTPILVPGGLVERAAAITPSNIPSPKPVQGGEVGHYEVKLSGEIDQSNIQEITTPITDQVHAMKPGSILTLDFADVEYINSTFIGNLASWHTSLQHKGGEVRLKNMRSSVKQILDLVGLLKVIKS